MSDIIVEAGWVMIDSPTREIKPTPVHEGRHACIAPFEMPDGSQAWYLKILDRNPMYRSKHARNGSPFAPRVPRMVKGELGWRLVGQNKTTPVGNDH